MTRNRVKNPHISSGLAVSQTAHLGSQPPKCWYPHSPDTGADAHLLGRALRAAASADPPWPGDRASSAPGSFSHTCVPGPTAEHRSPPRVCDVSSPVADSANDSGGVWQRSEPRPLVGCLEAHSPPIDSRRGSSGVLRVSRVDQRLCG